MSAGLSGLVGTLTPTNLQSAAEVDQQRQLEELARLLTTTQGEAAQAGQAYNQAAAAPPPELNPADVFMPALLSNIASVISQNPSYQQDRQVDLVQQRKALLESRAQNLKALSDVYAQKADAAQRTGDLLAQEKARTALDRVNKAHDVVMESLQQQGAMGLESARAGHQMDLERLRGANDLATVRATAAAKPDPLQGFDPSSYVVKTQPSDVAPEGRQFVDLSALTGKLRDAATAWASRNGMPALNTVDAQGVRDVDRARLDMTSLNDYIQGLMPANAGERAQKYMNMKLSALFQTDEQRAAFRTWRDTAIPTLRGLAGSRGLRISIQQINLMLQNLPRDTDTIGVVQRKFKIINSLLTNAETPLVTRNFGKNRAAGTGDKTVDTEAPPPGARVYIPAHSRSQRGTKVK
jgi:hypothetical protein